MTARLTTEIVVFRNSFAIPGWRSRAPAGTYTVETEAALIEGLSFPAFRRVSTTITRNAGSARGLLQTIQIDPDALAAALAMDRARAVGQDA